ncbi:uncharacterized protein LOC142526781 isoform X2 [Primulina tabacum]|uniref:uncharacterized protein LOC142526781 isoform X2 n=1 Tax=Primulina tabacum TaxID=48773 RepID=UPI003F5A6301
MDAGNSSEWLPPGFAEKTEVKNGRIVKYYYNVTTGVKYHSKKDVIHCATEDFFRDAPQKTNFDDNGDSSDNKFDAISPKWLPDGWRMEEKIRKNGSSAGSTYKVCNCVEGVSSSAGSTYKIYIDSSTGHKFYSKLAVARYLETIDKKNATTEQPKLDNVGEPSLKPDMYLQCKSLSEVDCFHAKNLRVASDSTSADGLPPSEAGIIPRNKSKRKTSFTMVDSETTSADVIPPSVSGSTPGKNSKRKKSFNVVDAEITSADAVPPLVAGSIPGKNSKRKKSFSVVDTETTSVIPPSVVGSTPGKNSKRKNSCTMVAVEITPADGLPSGWVKEIKTSKSGNKIRKDPYYIEPVNGYMFLSKKDALRYLETNDIGSCACMPKRKEFDKIKLNKNEVTPDNVGEPFPKSDTVLQSKSMTDTDCSPQKKNKQSSSMVSAERTSVEGLPNGWIKEIMTRKSGNKIRKDAYYTDPVTGYMFRSKNDALRYLKTSDIGSCAVKPKMRELGDLTLTQNKIPVDNVGFNNLKPAVPSQSKSMRDEDCISEKKNKHTSAMVPTESTSADGLPPGWIKEVKTSKSGNKIRKDSYYIDPVDGYIFLSKRDVLRYLETNDIGSCAITPKRRKMDNFNLIKSGIPVDNEGETFSKPETPLQVKSITDEGCNSEQNKGKPSLAAVAAESSSVEGLPPGWIKEIRASKSGNKIRKDPYYTDPISGYVFRSKKDVMRYLETNDIGSCAVTPKRREPDDLKLIENKINVKNVARPHLMPDVSVPKSTIDTSCTTETEKKSQHSITTVANEFTTDDDLPPGWIKEIKTSESGDKIRKDLYYTDPVSGYIFRSKKDVLRFLDTNDIRSCAIRPKRRETNDFQSIKETPLDNSGESSLKPEASMKYKSMINAAYITEIKKNSQQPSPAVAIEIASTDGLPPGWIKEIKTSQSGDKIRKDPFYTDPVSGYIFRSKKDVLRYLETNDISSCASRPKRREIDCPSSIKKKTSSSPINKKLSKQLETKTKLFIGEESNANGEGVSSTKTQAASKADTFTVASAGSVSLKEMFSCENSNKRFDMKMGPAHTEDCSKQGEKAMADVLAICSFINDTFTEEKFLDSEMENRTHGTQSELRKSKKRRDLNLPLRASKRLAKSEPEMLSNVELSERTCRAATKRSSATSVPRVPLPSDLGPTKKVADHANAVVETLRGEDPLNNVEKPLGEGNATLNEEPSNKVKNPLAEDDTNFKEQTVGKTNGKQPNDDVTSQDTQPCYEFGDSWTDPCLEFAYKTLTGEIPLDDTSPFPEIRYNQDGGIQTLASEEPSMFESEIPPGFESTNQNNSVGNVPASPSFYLSAVDALFESEIPPGFESVAQNKNADKSPANPSLSSPRVSTETGFSDKRS